MNQDQGSMLLAQARLTKPDCWSCISWHSLLSSETSSLPCGLMVCDAQQQQSHKDPTTASLSKVQHSSSIENCTSRTLDILSLTTLFTTLEVTWVSWCWQYIIVSIYLPRLSCGSLSVEHQTEGVSTVCPWSRVTSRIRWKTHASCRWEQPGLCQWFLPALHSTRRQLL